MGCAEVRALYDRQRRNYARHGLVYDDSKTTGRSWVGGKEAQVILEDLLNQLHQAQIKERQPGNALHWRK